MESLQENKKFLLFLSSIVLCLSNFQLLLHIKNTEISNASKRKKSTDIKSHRLLRPIQGFCNSGQRQIEYTNTQIYIKSKSQLKTLCYFKAIKLWFLFIKLFKFFYV